MINSKFLLSAMFAMACSATVFAQEDSFDLSSQRGEKQDVNMVPGKKSIIMASSLTLHPTTLVLTLSSSSTSRRA